LTLRREAALVFKRGVAGHSPAGWVAKNKNGQSPFLVGAREGAALPLYDFEFELDFKDFDFKNLTAPAHVLFYQHSK
jgi:hypothetical protein